MQDTTQVIGKVWDFVSNNQLGAGIVSGLVVAGVIAVVPPLRAHFVRLVKWVARFIGQGARRLSSGVRRLGSGNKQTAVDVTPLIQERDNLRHERDKAKEELENWKREAVDARQYMKYGEPLPEFGRLSEVRHEDVVTRVSELGPTSGWMITYCAEVWRGLQPRHKEGDPDSAVKDLIHFLTEKAHYPLNNTAQALNEYVQARLDPRPFLICYYKRYREWRWWILKVAKYLNVDVRTLPKYSEWKQYDTDWHKELTQKIASPNLREVASAIRDYDQLHGNWEPLPEAEPPYTGPTQSGPGLC